MIDEAKIWKYWARKVQESESLRRIFYKRRENMKPLSCLARPTTPILLMRLLVMTNVLEVYRKVLRESSADKEKANTQRDTDELMDDSRCGNSEHVEQL